MQSVFGFRAAPAWCAGTFSHSLGLCRLLPGANRFTHSVGDRREQAGPRPQGDGPFLPDTRDCRVEHEQHRHLGCVGAVGWRCGSWGDTVEPHPHVCAQPAPPQVLKRKNRSVLFSPVHGLRRPRGSRPTRVCVINLIRPRLPAATAEGLERILTRDHGTRAGTADSPVESGNGVILPPAVRTSRLGHTPVAGSGAVTRAPPESIAQRGARTVDVGRTGRVVVVVKSEWLGVTVCR